MELRPLDLPAVWRGSELFERDDWLHELSDNEVLELDRWSRNSLTDGESESADLAIVCPDFTRRLKRIQDSLEHGSGAAMIRGLDIEGIPKELLTPVFLAIAREIGTPLSQSASGDLIFSVRNEGFSDNDPRARGPNTRRKLSFHTDRCDVIGFLCVRQAKSGGENQLVSSPALYNEILSRRPDLLKHLMQPYCYQRHNVDTANELPYTRQPIFSFCDGYFGANFLRVLIERAHANPELPAMTDEQREALDYLETVAADPCMHVSFRQRPGDIVLMNNWITLHRRNAFEDYDDLKLRRHILRVWLSMPNSRPVDARFAGNYGATRAGHPGRNTGNNLTPYRCAQPDFN